MTTDQPTPDPLDTWLTAGHVAFVADLANALNLDAGASEAMAVSHFTDLTDALAATLDLDAGLSAVLGPDGPAPIIPAEPAPAPSIPAEPAPDPWPVPQHDIPNRSWTTRLTKVLDALDAPARLRLRTRTTYRNLHAAVHTALVLTTIHDNSTKLVGTLVFDDPVLARNLVRNIAHDLERAIDLAFDLELDLSLAHDREFYLAIDLVHSYARELEFELGRPRPHPRVRALALALVDVLVRPLERTLDLTHRLAHDLEVDLQHVLDFDNFYSLDFHSLTHDDLVVDLGVPVGDRELRGVQACLDRVGDDFAGADLSKVPLADIPLDGIRWSNTTRWPPGSQERIRALSTEIEPGVFEVAEPGSHDRDLVG